MSAQIHAYVYEAAVHCVACTVARFSVPACECTKNTGYGCAHTLSDGTREECDENCIPLDSQDNEGNTVSVILVWDGWEEGEVCGTCDEAIS